jgi:uncharacterized protein YecT (DUF1311 family)
MEDCAGRRREKFEAELERTYEKIMKELDPKRQELLAKAQRAWEAFRAADCAASVAQYEGGTMAILQASACRWSLAKERVADLRSIYTDVFPVPWPSTTPAT